MQVTRQQLNTGWRFQDIPRPGASPTTRLPWLPAEVPGHVHLDLLRAGAIPDPFYRLNERAVAWVDETDFVYETTFHVDAPAPACAYLVFHGLDTVAEITLNGETLGYADNMFIPHEFPVGGRLNAGEGAAGDNLLRVVFSSPLRVGRERHQAWDAAGNDTAQPDWFHWGPRSFVRKAQYMYGWDWGPELLGCGLWQGVELVTVPVARITDWKYDVEFTDDNKAIVTVTADVERSPGSEDTPLTLTMGLPKVEVPIKIQGNGIHSLRGYPTGCKPTTAVLPTGVGTVRISAILEVENPRRWYPSGYGDAALYLLDLTLMGDTKIESLPTKIGLRTIELIREGDSLGEGFKYRVNGIDVFAKGANWIPNDSFPARISSHANTAGTYRWGNVFILLMQQVSICFAFGAAACTSQSAFIKNAISWAFSSGRISLTPARTIPIPARMPTLPARKPSPLSGASATTPASRSGAAATKTR